ncbi:MAG: Cell division protein FtsK [Labilithrix sp.]|nr:Cell division protein FtsK [Labilithrix sp.]
MLPSNTHGDVVVRLLSGESGQHELVLKAGCPIPPIALGTHGGWIIQGRQVARVHVMLAWSGETLFVGTPGGEAALLDGFPLGTRWTAVRAPSELQFGSARLSIGRRAGADEETEVPPEDRVWTDDQVTSMDDGRILEALRLTRDDEVTCIAEVEVPPAARRPAPVVRRRSDPPTRLERPTTPPPLPPAHRAPANESLTHLHALPSSNELREEDAGIIESCSPTSSLPPTIPSEGLIPIPMSTWARPIPVAVARPSQPTMAIPEPHGAFARTGEQTFAPPSMDSIGAGALAVSGEHASNAHRARATESTVVRRKKDSALEAGWRQASFPKKAIAVLMMPALLGALLMTRSAPAARAHAPGGAGRTSAVAVAAPSATVTTASTTTVAVGASAAPVPSTISTAVESPASPVKAGAPALRDARTAERRALDAAASGQDAAAAEQYDALAAAHPETVAFREAARILRGRVMVRHD